MPEGVEGSVTARKKQTTEEPFRPGEKRIVAVLQPVEEEEVYVPEASPMTSLSYPAIVEKRSVVMDIETTGVLPWESRIVCIGALDTSKVLKEEDIVPNMIIFTAETEEATVRAFIDWFTAQKFTEIIGYNLSFDTRFIFAKCMRFRIPCGAFVDASLYDLCQVMKQVKQEFVFGFNKPGDLAAWSEYLLGEQKFLDYEGILKAWKNKRVDLILAHNRQDIVITYKLWALVQFTGEGNV